MIPKHKCSSTDNSDRPNEKLFNEKMKILITEKKAKYQDIYVVKF